MTFGSKPSSIKQGTRSRPRAGGDDAPTGDRTHYTESSGHMDPIESYQSVRAHKQILKDLRDAIQVCESCHIGSTKSRGGDDTTVNCMS